MTQRNPMNERYQQEDEHLGQTRKSAASAKPVTRAAATTHEPAPLTKKQKRQLERERVRKEEEKAREQGKDLSASASAQYRQYRKQWWIALIAGIACTLISWLVSTVDSLAQYSAPFLIAAYVLIIYALYLDIGKMRKLRRGEVGSQVAQGKSKETRRQQKAEAQRRRELEKRAQEIREEDQAKKEEPKPSLMGKLKDRFSKEEPAAAESADDAKTETAAK